MVTPENGSALSERERRHSQRLLLDVPLIVRGESAEHAPFREETFTISVNAHGALLLLSAKVAIGQALFLMNAETRDEREGRVARFGSPYGGLAQVAVEFPQPAGEFWHVHPLPQGWTSART
jgi:hypothetical protein